MHIELVAFEVSNETLTDRCAPHVLRWLRVRQIPTTIDLSLRPGTFAPHAVRVSTSVEDIRSAREAGYGLILAIARTDEQHVAAIVAGADVVLPAFASVPGALLAAMRTRRRNAPTTPRVESFW